MSNDVDLALTYDVLIVGAGPAGLAAAIHIKQLSPSTTVCVLEKAAAIGAHQLSGAIVPADYLAPLASLQNFATSPPDTTPLSTSKWCWLTKKSAIKLPSWLLPPAFKHSSSQPEQLIQLSSVCRWLGDEALNLGVEIFTAQAAVSAIYNEQDSVIGVMTGEMGCMEDGSPGPQYAPGIAIHASYTLLAEGAKGSLSRDITKQFGCAAKTPQHYGIGFKERWHLPKGGLVAGQVIHTMGWPLGNNSGGGFLYAFSEHELAVGLILQLDYPDATLDPFTLYQQFKQHPSVASLLEGAECQGFGARTLVEGGWQSLGKLTFPGGAFLGCAGGLLDLLRQQGIPHAIQSGALAAKACVNALAAGRSHDELSTYELDIKNGPIGKSLRKAAAIKPALGTFGGIIGTTYVGLHYWLNHVGLCLPKFQYRRADHEYTQASKDTPQETGIALQRDNSLYLARIKHNETQPEHLYLVDGQFAHNYTDSQAKKLLCYCCPAGVYVEENDQFIVRANRCLHCKCCEIKDLKQQIHWTPPEGGSGPAYIGL
ncbi:electron-transfer flavoprotein:ubiquinone oxidoreductase [uncultured Tolumonas sp.]|uniref:electron transfer flavoprotein-ubiquinone oxidoreductase n=1 Tax=uncultured Tolumonas sp. TaxID=263765 RepID=UPI00292FA4D0|nr:electron-transfer flavoprotein:ubiquinone oxidoreductase [uncultured Tolumonas sp.]